MIFRRLMSQTCLRFRAVAIALLLITSTQIAQPTAAAGQPKTFTTWVRGKVIRQGKPNYPASRVRVTAVPKAYKDDDAHAMITYTGIDGRFDFKLAPGDYVIKVWVSTDKSSNYLISVRGGKYLDIAPVVIPK